MLILVVVYYYAQDTEMYYWLVHSWVNITHSC